MLKKIISLTLSFVLMLAFTGCGANKNTGTSSAAVSSVASTAASLAASSSASSSDAAASSSTDAASGGTGVISEDKLFPLTTDGMEFKSLKYGTLQDLIDSFPGSFCNAGDNPIDPGVSTSSGDNFSLPNTTHAFFRLTFENKTQEDQKPQNCAIKTLELLSKDSEFPCGVKYMYAADGSTSLSDVLKTFGNPKEANTQNLYCTTWDIGNGGASISFYFSNDKDTPDNEILSCVFNDIDELD